MDYSIHRVPVRRNWVPPPPFPEASVCPPWTQRGGEVGQHSLAGEGMGGLNSDDWTKSLSLCILCGVKEPFVLVIFIRVVCITCFSNMTSVKCKNLFNCTWRNPPSL